MLDISQVILMRTDSNLCRKELTVHWSTPNSLIRSYLQPCTNSMWGGWKWSCGSHYLIIPDCGCPKGGSFLCRTSHNPPELWVSLCPSVCPSIPHIVSTLWLVAYLMDYIHMWHKYNPWADDVSSTISRLIGQWSRSHGNSNWICTLICSDLFCFGYYTSY